MLDSATETYENRDMKVADALLNYKKNVYNEQETRRKEQLEIFQKAQDRQFNAIAGGITASGGVVAIGTDGMPTYMLDSHGTPVKSMDLRQLEAQLGKMSHEVIDGELVYFGQDGSRVYPERNGLSYSDITGEYTEGDISVGGMNFNGGDYGTAQGNNSECVGGGRFFNGDLSYGLYTLQDKRDIYSGFTEKNDAQAGDTVFFATKVGGAYAQAGHVATVITADPANNKMLVAESNFNLDGKWGLRWVDMDKIDQDPNTGSVGIFRGANPNMEVINGIAQQYYYPKTETAQTSVQTGQTGRGVFGNLNPKALADVYSYNDSTLQKNEKANLIARATKGGYIDQVQAYSTGNYTKQLGDNSKYTEFLRALDWGGDRKSKSEYIYNVAQNAMGGDMNEVKSDVMQKFTEKLGADPKKQFIASQTILDNMAELSGLITQAEEKTGYIGGNIQKLKQKLGQSGDTQLAYLNTRIAKLIQMYTKGQSGAQFSAQEFDRYESIFPGISNVGKLNTAKISAMKDNIMQELDMTVRANSGDKLSGINDLISDSQIARLSSFGLSFGEMGDGGLTPDDLDEINKIQ